MADSVLKAGKMKLSFSIFFSGLAQCFFASFLQPKPSSDIPVIAPDFSLLFQPFVHPGDLLFPEILYHWQMMSPNGTVTELNQLRAGEVVAVFTCFELPLLHATLVNVAGHMMLNCGTGSTYASATVAGFIL